MKKRGKQAWPQTIPVGERMAWSAKLLAETDVLDVIMNWGRDMIYFKDRQSRFFFVSRSQALRFGTQDVAKIIGTSDFDHFTREHALPAFRDERKIIRAGKPVIEIVEKETWPDGTFNWVSTSKFPLRDKKGRVIGTWGISRDVTALKKAEDALEAANKELLPAFTHRHAVGTAQPAGPLRDPARELQDAGAGEGQRRPGRVLRRAVRH